MRRLARYPARFLALPGAERRLLAEAAATLALASALLALLPFATAMRLAGLNARTGTAAARQDAPAPEAGTTAPAVGAAVARAARHLPFRAVCLQQAIACTLMLRRRALPVTVHFGMAKNAAGALDAHAWSVSGGAVVTGAPGRERFTPIAVFAA
ncbi:lasso peptide biosynthesis B2 protein [Azospirillum sp.]|uniref:lasso peptide biosynthesis B2 protein n=1 Tax=Azospirillum sp. TaxID=34012 RepID=UPI002D4E342A|nr:lasso peptide biosynthesis B2 protein [Azospirillum sp.]HYD69827.1 lasso peptide biosynthesis B2 protein [Azospirillum sp.]